MKNHKFTRIEKSLFALPLLMLTFPFWRNLLEDDLNRTQRQLAGSTAVDLGRVYGHGAENLKLHEVCAAAFTAKKPFRARFDQQDREDWPTAQPFSVSQGIVGTPDGKIYFVYLTGRDKRLTTIMVPKPRIWTYSNGTRRISSSTPIPSPPPFD